jgi:cell division protein FtsI (penicillin-binding protein 3)
VTTATRALYPRLAAVGAAVATVVVVLALRLVDLGVLRAHTASADAITFPVDTSRGAIWDRHGALVALERYTYRASAAPREVTDPVTFAAGVAPLLGLPEAEVLDSASNTDRTWVELAAGVSVPTTRALEGLKLDGLHLERVPERAYPLDETAAHLVGFVNREGKSFYGVEEQHDDVLRGTPGAIVGRFGSDPRAYRAPRDGDALILTIDRDIQVAAYELLRAAVEAQSADGGTVIVLAPDTGAILASASVPSYDPNHFAEADPGTFPDPAVSAVYEPGSVIKALTMAAALDAGLVTPESTYEDTGAVDVAGMHIANWDNLAHGTTTMTELLQHSLNVGAVHVAALLGSDRFYRALAAFGLGAPTGVDLAGEVAGTVHDPALESDWYEGNLASNSFGQGMDATPLQVAAAISAIANDGRLMRPYVVAARVRPDGEVVSTAPQLMRQVVSPGTARTVRGMLQEVVRGKVTQAAVPGHSVGGKTGTSQVPVPGGYDPRATIASFAGFLPVDHPRVVILVKIDHPDAVRGSEVAAPVFAQVARAVIDALDIPSDEPVRRAGDGP